MNSSVIGYPLEEQKREGRVSTMMMKLDIDTSALNAGLDELEKRLDKIVKKYEEALDLQHKLKEGEDDGNEAEV